ncbi:hypothetical protein AAJCM20276_27390 [Acetobacter aceti]|uniref:Uncharacterized protein n=1 Tax=Acetobacter aceti TaxID=435 RepID=A0A6S6PN67_ACEAC|nr:hypothetical protein AAJCM20276_27390 [Acetobacter aceti]
MPKGLGIDIGNCGFGWSRNPPSIRLWIIAFYIFEHGLGVVVLGYRASLMLERMEKKNG